MKSDRKICNETNYPHDSALTERFVVKSTVESCDKIKVAVSQIFDRVKSVTLRAIRALRGYWLQVNGGQGGSFENVSSRKFQI
jgi:hypothetical protein